MINPSHHTVAITGATGYIGSRLSLALLARGHEVRAIVRPSSESRLPKRVQTAVTDVMSEEALVTALRGCDTVVHLIGTPNPNPGKAQEFVRVDLASVQACAPAAKRAAVNHFIYISVAQPAPVMKAYVDVRAEAERVIGRTGLRVTILRPWYVLGPGHRWPMVLIPLYRLAARIPSVRDAAQRLGLVTVEQMINALLQAIEKPDCFDEGGGHSDITILAVPEIRAASLIAGTISSN